MNLIRESYSWILFVNLIHECHKEILLDLKINLGNRTVGWSYMRGALKYLAHIESASPPRTADGCQKLLNAYKIVRELKAADNEERTHLNNAVDDLRVILQVGNT